MGRPADATAVLDKLSADARYWGVAKAKTADLQHAEGRTADAFRTVDEVIAKQPALVRRAPRTRSVAPGRPVVLDEALVEAQTAIKAEPQNAEAQFLLASVQEARARPAAAAAAYGEVLKINPRASAAQVRLAMVEMQRNDLGAATQLAEQAATAQPGDLRRSWSSRAVSSRAANSIGPPRVTQQLAASRPDVAIVQNQVGMLALARGDKAGARAAFERALALNGALVEPLAMLVCTRLAEQQGARARARIEPRLAAGRRRTARAGARGTHVGGDRGPAKGEELCGGPSRRTSRISRPIRSWRGCTSRSRSSSRL